MNSSNGLDVVGARGGAHRKGTLSASKTDRRENTAGVHVVTKHLYCSIDFHKRHVDANVVG